MKTISSRTVTILGGLLALTLAAGCFSGGRESSNSPYGYNGTFYTSKPYDGGYGNPYPYNSGYNDTHSFPQSFGNSNSYSSGLQHGVPAEASRDHHYDRASDQHVAVVATRPRDQARNERRHTTIDTEKDSRKD
jgi:hypothetical protein